MKMNKKGFTLIEMLVVIAIIAVLVAIIIPTVSSATVKAAAATNAANLRSLQAEAATDFLAGVDNDTGLVKYTAASKALEARDDAPAPKAVGAIYTPTAGATAEIEVDTDTGIVTASYDGHDVAYFAEIAETGKAPAAADPAA